MRHHQLPSTMMKSDRSLEDWGNLIGNTPGAGGSRFIKNTEVIKITRERHRLLG